MLSFIFNKIDTNNINFFNNLNFFLKNKLDNKYIENFVKNVIFNIKKYKDKALFYYINKYESFNIKNINDIKLDYSDIKKAYYNLNKKNKYLLECCFNRIKFFHEEQKNIFHKNWKIIESDGNFLGQKSNFIEKLGFYIPGGKAIYPSSIFMNTASSNILNIKDTTLVIPINKNNNNYNLVLSALYLSNINHVYLMGGAHAISALSYGTNLIKKVDKIFGPGNIFVSLAKKIIYGDTGIDMIAGPSEVLILVDDYFYLNNLVLDLFSQSEHDILAQSIIICSNYKILIKIEEIINELIPFMYRKKIILGSLKERSFFIKTNNLIESCNIINYIAPEHLIIYSKNYNNIFKYIKNSGSVFLGYYCSESFGDYSIGLNHILPTYKNSKFSSSLGIYDFSKKINFSSLNNLGFKKLFYITSKFAMNEGLFSHSESVLLRNLF
ncbi:Histidinol dehydrogenase [Candidatus Nasuia deltocephalinicola]|nr:Histidinol dehydrogenase [Candidatus Nasuia deltocephalinicola]